ncbi:hypothetical protein [Helicobacter fennelliae]|uniref:Uncharacterized protein n=1 Tax=Helicobacter fennelliae MRY12-0050 TaxID=1325130 RepID=T1D2C1_9HELI|nr:hypothetical protein [Helicobacter fennelliae]GAD19366.1 hypothetical protein HFN_0497 [Helicobacter fennelliae MRY12-0050]STP08411.1 Uncharacterised protein [Helicobacter fennelliae]STQ84826.1 Uncharacterised protein [Helicobacter fennelliae]
MAEKAESRIKPNPSSLRGRQDEAKENLNCFYCHSEGVKATEESRNLNDASIDSSLVTLTQVMTK